MAGICLNMMCNHFRRMLLPITWLLGAMVVLSQFWALAPARIMPTLLPGEEASPFAMIRSTPSRNLVVDSSFAIVEGVGMNETNVIEDENEGLVLDHERSEHDVAFGKEDLSKMKDSQSVKSELKQLNILHKDNVEDTCNKNVSTDFSTRPTLEFRNESCMIERYVRKMRGATITFSEMKSMLLNRPASTTSVVR